MVGRRKPLETDRPAGGAAGWRKVVQAARPPQGAMQDVRDDAPRQKRMAEGQVLVAEWARQGRLPEGITPDNWFRRRLCLQFQAGNCKFGGEQEMVKKEGGDVLCGSPVSYGPHTHTQGAGGGRAVAGLPGAKRARNKIAAEL